MQRGVCCPRWCRGSRLGASICPDQPGVGVSKRELRGYAGMWEARVLNGRAALPVLKGRTSHSGLRIELLCLCEIAALSGDYGKTGQAGDQKE